MPASPASGNDDLSVGEQRLQELIGIRSAPLEQCRERMQALSWIQLREVIDHDVVDPRAFTLVYTTLADLLLDVGAHQRGPLFLGRLGAIELDFGLHVDAHYDPQRRVLRVSLGILLLLNELRTTSAWLDAVLFEQALWARPGAIDRLETPPAVLDELRRFARDVATGLAATPGGDAFNRVSQACLQFVIAHELAHAIHEGESERLQAQWTSAIWAQYDDALEHAVGAGEMSRANRASAQRSSLDAGVRDRWARELIADGLGFHTAQTLAYRHETTGRFRRYAELQAGAEFFLHALLLGYRHDIATAQHPSPRLRSAVLRAGQRQLCRADWNTFLSDHWVCGTAVSRLLLEAKRRIDDESR